MANINFFDEEKETRITRFPIGNKYMLCKDKYCLWIEQLRKGKKKKNGTESDAEQWYRASGYCRTFEELFANFAKLKIRDSEADSVEQQIEKISKAEKECLKMIKEAAKSLNVK